MTDGEVVWRVHESGLVVPGVVVGDLIRWASCYCDHGECDCDQKHLKTAEEALTEAKWLSVELFARYPEASEKRTSQDFSEGQRVWSVLPGYVVEVEEFEIQCGVGDKDLMGKSASGHWVLEVDRIGLTPQEAVERYRRRCELEECQTEAERIRSKIRCQEAYRLIHRLEEGE